MSGTTPRLRPARNDDSGVRELPAPRRPRGPPKRQLGVVGQVRAACAPRARLATTLGCLLGGLVPVGSYWLAHHEIDASSPLYTQLTAYLVAGGLLFSAKTVIAWARLAFGDAWKAFGFTMLLEGTLLASHTPWLSCCALGYLVAINGIATGCTLSLRDRK